MTPAVPAVLAELAALLIRAGDPAMPAGERASELGLSAALLGILAETWDRQAHILVEENAAIRALLGEAGEDADFRLSALKSENDRLRAALIKAQIAAEQSGDQAMQAAIWRELAASTERRRLSTAPV